MTRTLRLFAALALLAPLLGPAARAQDEPAARWDQERVTAYARELAQAAEALDAAMDEMPEQVVPAHQRAFYQARDDIRMLERAAQGFAKQLEAGASKEAVAPRFARIQALRRSAEENGRKALIPDAVMAKATPVGGALIKLAPYFRE